MLSVRYLYARQAAKKNNKKPYKKKTTLKKGVVYFVVKRERREKGGGTTIVSIRSPKTMMYATKLLIDIGQSHVYLSGRKLSHV